MKLENLTKMYDFSGRTVVITGGSGVLGRVIAKGLLGCRANVAVIARNPAKAREVLGNDGNATGNLFIARGDVQDADALQSAAAEVTAEFGKMDALINGAGGNNPRATTGADRTFFQIPPEAFREVLDLNLQGTVLSCQIFGKSMAERGEGIILNISSMAAFQPLTKVIGYSAAKAAVNNFTQWLAVHMAREYSPKIRVNAVAPGFFITAQNRFLLTEKNTGELTARGKTIIAQTPMNRFGNPEDLLGGVLWLLSPASAFVTGIVLPIDGGFNAFSGV